MVYLIYGPEPYRRDIEVKKITKGAMVIKVESFTVECEDILESISLFGKSVVVLRLASLGADDVLLKYLQKQFPMQNDLILAVDGKVNEKTKIFSFISQKGIAFMCDKLNHDKLTSYCLSAVKYLGCQITKAAMEALIDRSGYLLDDQITLYKMNIYLKQLAYHTKAINVEDVEVLVPKYAGENARQILSLLIARRNEELMKLVVQLLDARQQPIMMYGLMLRDLRIVYKAALFSDMDEKELGKMLGLSFYQMKRVSDVRKISEKNITDLIYLLQKGTNEIKDGFMPAPDSFIRTVGEMVSVLSS